jgi:lipid II:glycine glycyltransferase (peptidoglycan interpeptide bridge formation enzyme)
VEDQGLGFALAGAGYRVASKEATMVVDLEAFNPDCLDPVLRRNLRKAEKEGVHVHATTRLEAFYDVLTANLEAKGATPTHSLDELRALFSLYPDRLILLEAVLKDRVIGGCLVVVCNSRVGLAFYICDDREHSQARASEATLMSAAGLLQRSGCKYLDLGTVSTAGEVNWGLARFKAKFGPVTQVRERYVLDFEEAGA